MKHVHADLIHQWAEGAKIQWKCHDTGWFDTDTPEWDPGREYRVKPPPPKPIIDVSITANFEGIADYSTDQFQEEIREALWRCGLRRVIVAFKQRRTEA